MILELAQARKDLNAARLLASPEPSRSVFHSQQAAEKAAKAFITFHDVTFRKTHDLNELGGPNPARSTKTSLKELTAELEVVESHESEYPA